MPRYAWDHPTVAGSIVQGILGGLAVGVVFVAVAYPLARRDMRGLMRRGKGAGES